MREEEFVAIELEKIVLILCYISPRFNLREFSDILSKIEDKIKILGKKKRIIIKGILTLIRCYGVLNI